ncbi:hypothetical protein BB558_005191, partial [Smittium angustum]
EKGVSFRAVLELKPYLELLKLHGGFVDKEIKFGDNEETLVKSFFSKTSRFSVVGGLTGANNQSGLNSPGSGGTSNAKNFFSLGSRGNVVFSLNNKAIPLFGLNEEVRMLQMEQIFYNLNLAIVDNATAEFEFIMDFFVSPRIYLMQRSITTRPETEMASMIFSHIFEPVIDIGTSLTKSYQETSFDTVGILLCIRSIPNFLSVLQKRQVPTLDSYFNSLNLILWPKFQQLMDLHINRINKISLKKLSGRKFDTFPHLATRQYSELTSTIIRMNMDFDASVLSTGLVRIRAHIDNFLKKQSLQAPDNQAALVFLINNYDLILMIYKENLVDGDNAESVYWQNLNAETIFLMCEELMLAHFGYLKSFVLRADRTSINNPISMEELCKVAVQFNSEWKTQTSLINSTIVHKFANFMTGTSVVHDTLRQLIIVYTQFVEIYEKFLPEMGQSPAVVPVGVHSVMLEIKKYRPLF